MAKGSAKGIRAGRAYVELGTDNVALARGLRAAQQQLRAFGDSLRQIGTRMLAIGGGIVTPLLGAAKVFSDWGDQLDKMSGRTGISVEALSELAFAASQSGATMEELEKSTVRMQRAIVEAGNGSKTMIDAFERLGLRAEDLRGLAPEQQFALIAERISRISDPAERAALAMELLGRSGTRLLPLMMGGARGIQALRDQAARLGLTMSGAAAKSAAALNDSWDALARSARNIMVRIGGAIAPLLTRVSDRMTRLAVAVGELVERNKGVFVTALQVGTAVFAVGGALVAAGVAAMGMAALLGLAATTVAKVVGLLAAMKVTLVAVLSPVGLVTAGIVGLAGAALHFSGVLQMVLDWAGKSFNWLGGVVRDSFGAIGAALASGDLEVAARVGFLGVRLVWLEGTEWIRGVWRTLMADLARASLVAFVQIEKAITLLSASAPGAMEVFAQHARRTALMVLGFFRNMPGFEGMYDRAMAANEGQTAGVSAESLDKLRKAQELVRNIDRLLQGELGAIDERAADAVSAAVEELKKARQEWEAVVEAAKSAGAVPKLAGPGRMPQLPDPDELEATLQRTTQSAMGTFNIAALAGLGGNRTETLLQQLNRTTEMIKRNIQHNDLFQFGA